MFLNVNIRPEKMQDSKLIHDITLSAFKDIPYSNHKEQSIIEQLREHSALAVSLVAEYQGELIGHIAFSLVTINNQECPWYGLAPVSVKPDYQKSGVGTQLINAGLEAIKSIGAQGCVLLGDPEYYGRFGFKAMDSLVLEGVPPEYFLSLSFNGELPAGKVGYHQAFADNS